MVFKKILGMCLVGVSVLGHAEDAYKIFGKKTPLSSVRRAEQAAFYELEQKRFDLVKDAATESYFKAYWEKEAKKVSKTPQEAEKNFFDKNVKISKDQIEKTLSQYKDEPQLAAMSKEQQEKEVGSYLRSLEMRKLREEMVRTAQKNGDLVILLSEPQEPVYQVALNKDDRVRYGPKLTDVDSSVCGKKGCAVTIIEYSEFQCPFCSRVLPTSEKVLEEYKGKVAWAVRDFPLNFHPKARPAAVASQCAKFQGADKYWAYYDILFENQRNLDSADLLKYAEKISLDMKKFKECLDKPAEAEAIVDANYRSGIQLGVTGTPAFFINGRRLSGALPYPEFKRVIDEELAKSQS
ncbi:MAG: DsbA family protein [Oligoflexales bacterium]